MALQYLNILCHTCTASDAKIVWFFVLLVHVEAQSSFVAFDLIHGYLIYALTIVQTLNLWPLQVDSSFPMLLPSQKHVGGRVITLKPHLFLTIKMCAQKFDIALVYAGWKKNQQRSILLLTDTISCLQNEHYYASVTEYHHNFLLPGSTNNEN